MGKKRDYVLEYYYIILTSIYVLSIYLSFIRTGILLGACSLYLFIKYRNFINPRAGNYMYLFTAYSFLSIIGYIYNGLPISIYIQELPTQILPIIFYYIGYNNIVDKETVYKNFLISTTVAFIIGWYFYLNPTPHYIDYVVRNLDSSFEGSVGLITSGFNSIYGRIWTGSLGVFSMILVLNLFTTRLNKKMLYVSILLYLLFLVTTIMTAQRSSMVMLFFVIIVFPFYHWVTKVRIQKQFYIVNFLLYFIIAFCSFLTFRAYFDYWIERLDSVDSALSERDGQWKDYFKYSPNILFGTGLGAAGFHAIDYSKYYITDGGIFKYIAEFGIVGFAIFAIGVIKIMKNGLRNYSYSYREYMIISVALIQSIGSNVICVPQTLPLFYFALGVLAFSVNKKSIKCENNIFLSSSISPNSEQ